MKAAANWRRWFERLTAGEERALSEILTAVQNEPETHRELLSAIYDLSAKSPKARIFGMTGAPGAGKSTLLKALLRVSGADPKGLLLIDPSSPFSGGALLGDRLRLEDELSDRVFVRSLGTRGERGGLCRAARDLVRVLVASGRTTVFVETVGVGQTEVEIMDLADVTIVVLTPDSGDTVQTLKAGLLEIADIFVVNKADLPRADRMAADLAALNAAVPVFQTVATTGKGAAELWAHLTGRDGQGARERPDPRQRLAREVAQRIGAAIEKEVFDDVFKSLPADPAATDPYLLAERLRGAYGKKS